jgi:hypothetical protein
MSGRSDDELLQVASLREFFRESVDSAMDANHLSASTEASHYVVNLLTLFARAEVFHDSADDAAGRRPLALMLSDALDAPTAPERQYALQRLGDISLFVAGFFASDLQHSVVDIDYYISMGGGAYNSLSTQSRETSRGRAFAEIFAELGDKFDRFVDVLNDVRDQAGSASDADVLRLYDVWLKTGSPRAARLLRRQGIHTLPPGRTSRAH